MTRATSQAGPDIGFFRNTGIALIAATAISGAVTLTLTLKGDGTPVQISSASNQTPPVTSY